jgi:hypothetical protein
MGWTAQQAGGREDRSRRGDLRTQSMYQACHESSCTGNVFAIVRNKKEMAEKRAANGEFRKRIAFAYLTLGKVPYGSSGGGGPGSGGAVHKITTFANYASEHHQCGYCPRGTNGYWYCSTCFPPGTNPTHALCNPSKGRDCFAKHVRGDPPMHKINIGIKKKPRTPTTAAGARVGRGRGQRGVGRGRGRA